MRLARASLPSRRKPFHYALRIKDGAVHVRFGDDGKAGSTNFDGTIGADGSADIAVRGLTNPARDPLHRPPGTPFHYVFAIALKDSSGAAVRTNTPWPCRAKLTKLSATSSMSDDDASANKPSNEGEPNPAQSKPKAATRSNATAAVERSQREAALPPSRQMESGSSCSLMRGKCNAHCFARTGHPNCASHGCVRLERECLSTGCWRGRGFNSCGLARR